MPRYRVTTPDGRKFVVNAPEGATKEQALAFAQRQPKPRTGGSGIGWLDKVVSAGNEALIGIPQGIQNMGAFITDPISEMVFGRDTVKQAQGARQGAYDAASRALVANPNPTARTVGQIAGAAAVPIPKIPGAGKLVQLANRGVQGLLAGAAVRDSDESGVIPGVTGAIANMILPPLIAKAVQSKPVQAAGRAVAPALRPVMNVADDASEAALSRVRPKLGLNYSPLPAAVPTLPPAAPLAPLGRQAQARAGTFESLGLKPTTGMVTRDPAAVAFEQNTAKVEGVGENLMRQMREVESGLVRKSREMVSSAGGARGAEATGKTVGDLLDAKRAEMQQVTSGIYKQVRETRGDEVVGTLGGLRDTLRSPDIVDNATADGMRSSVMRRLQRLGLVDDVGSAVPGKTTTIGQAEELRKFIGGLGDFRDPTTRMVRKQLIDALDDDVVAAVGDDAFKAARASAKARFAEFSKTFAGKVADEGIAPERLVPRVMSATTRVSDIRALRQSLSTGTPDQIAAGKEGWQALKAQALDDFFAGSMDDEGKVLGGKLMRDFRKAAPKFRVLLDPPEYKQLQRIVAASRYATTVPPHSAVNFSNTAVTAQNIFGEPKGARNVPKAIAKEAVKHLAAGVISFPYANIALATGEVTTAKMAQQRAANEMIRRVSLAQNPQEYAAALAAAREAAKSNAVIADYLNRAGGFFGGGAAAATEPLR